MLQNLIGPVTGLLDKFIEDKDQKNALAHEIATMAEKQAHEIQMEQILTNREEAKHRSLFVAGWRPSVGWCCSIALFWHFVLQPVAVFGIAVFGLDLPDLPKFDMESLMTILLGLLGIGGLRTYEKQKGVAK